MTNQLSNRAEPASPAVQLAHFLGSGGQLPPLDRSSLGIATRPDENFYAVVPGALERYVSGGDGIYIKKTGIPVTPLGAALRVGKAVGNSRRKAKAAKLAREDWRSFGTGHFFLGDQRLVIQQNQGSDVIGLGSIVALLFDGSGIQIEAGGREPVRLVLHAADYYYVMLYKLAFGEAVLPPTG